MIFCLKHGGLLRKICRAKDKGAWHPEVVLDNCVFFLQPVCSTNYTGRQEGRAFCSGYCKTEMETLHNDSRLLLRRGRCLNKLESALQVKRREGSQSAEVK